MSKFNFNSQFSKLKEIMDNYSKKIGIDLDYFIKNSFLTILIQISNITLSLILTIFLARFTTKDVFGSYNFIISIISMLTIISMPGFNFTLIKSASRGKDGLYNKIFKLRFFWSLIGVPFLIFVGLYYFYFENQMIGLGLLLASIFFPFFDPPTIWVKLLQGKKRFDLVTKNSIIIIFIRTVTIIIATILGSGNIIPILIAFLIAHSSLNLLYYYKSKNLLINNEIEEK
jgi:Polysaccharide biosynthesis protein.